MEFPAVLRVFLKEAPPQQELGVSNLSAGALRIFMWVLKLRLCGTEGLPQVSDDKQLHAPLWHLASSHDSVSTPIFDWS